MPDESPISQWMHRRRIIRWSGGVLLALLVVSVALDHAGAFGYSGSDLQTFNRQSVTVTRTLDGDTIAIRRGGDDVETVVHLLGIDAPDLPSGHWAQSAATYTSDRLLGRRMTLRLDPVGWRNNRGELLAYVFATDTDNVNLDLIHDGQAYADRRVTHSLHAPFEVAEKEARLKKRGIWKNLTDDQMPAWRQEWLHRRFH